MPIWVKLNSIQYISNKGQRFTYNPGDWVQVSRQQAQVWLAQGAAEIPNISDYFETISSGAGIVTDDSSKAMIMVNGFGVSIEVVQDRPNVLFDKTMYWKTSLKLRPNLVGIGLNLLNIWEIAIPFESYDRLAVHAGTPAEREQTRLMIRDLRVPLYSTRLIFARKQNNITDLIDSWRNEVDEGHNPELSLLRQIYRVKPFILALPTTWIEGRPTDR
jgi:hypothetical protein